MPQKMMNRSKAYHRHGAHRGVAQIALRKNREHDEAQRPKPAMYGSVAEALKAKRKKV